MTATPTAGQFLTATSIALQQARDLTPHMRAATTDTAAAAHALAQVIKALIRSLELAAPGDNLTAGCDARHMRGWPKAALQAREALAKALRTLPAEQRAPSPSGPARYLTEAARSLTAAQDLLHTHFAPGPTPGSRTPASEWAPVISSEAVTRALAARAGAVAQQTAPLAARLGQMGLSGNRKHDRPARKLLTAAEALWAADAATRAANSTDPVTATGIELLHAIPSRATPQRRLPTPADPLPALCQGTVVAAERLRAATWRPPAPSAPHLSSIALRSTAAATVVISHNCAAALEMLAARAAHTGLAGLEDSLREHAATAHTITAAWLDVAKTWSVRIVTDTRAGHTEVSQNASDLAWWTGRLIYADPHWALAHGRRAELRHPDDLLPDPRQATGVIAAVQACTETLIRLAGAEQAQTQALAAAGRLYVPTRLLPPEVDIPRPFGPARREHLHGLTTTYQAALRSSTQLADALTAPAAALNAPTRVLAAARTVQAQSPPPEPPPHAPGPVTQLLRQRGLLHPGLLAHAAVLDEALTAAPDAGPPSPPPPGL
jgi:hypothetical protein